MVDLLFYSASPLLYCARDKKVGWSFFEPGWITTIKHPCVAHLYFFTLFTNSIKSLIYPLSSIKMPLLVALQLAFLLPAKKLQSVIVAVYPECVTGPALYTFGVAIRSTSYQFWTGEIVSIPGVFRAEVSYTRGSISIYSAFYNLTFTIEPLLYVFEKHKSGNLIVTKAQKIKWKKPPPQRPGLTHEKMRYPAIRRDATK